MTPEEKAESLVYNFMHTQNKVDAVRLATICALELADYDNGSFKSEYWRDVYLILKNQKVKKPCKIEFRTSIYIKSNSKDQIKELVKEYRKLGYTQNGSIELLCFYSSTYTYGVNMTHRKIKTKTLKS